MEPGRAASTEATDAPKPPAAAAPGRDGRLPRRALGALAVCLEAAVLGILAVVAANRVDEGYDPVLLLFGWVAFAVSAIAALVFAAHSGRLDGVGADDAAGGAAEPDGRTVQAARPATLLPPAASPGSPPGTARPR